MRLDRALAVRGIARSRNQAAQLIADGQVTVDGKVALKASQDVADDSELRVARQPWVSRAAHKLLGALAGSQTPVPARVLDAGASTGGFTAVCLSHGAQRVYAVDVGHDQLSPELRDDPRVVSWEGLNLRDLDLHHVEGEQVDLVVADVSFISLTAILQPMLRVLHDGGAALLLVKPQFEVGREGLGAGGVVRSEAARQQAVRNVVDHAGSLGWVSSWQGVSALPGASGNVEYFVKLERDYSAGARQTRRCVTTSE